MGDDRYAAPPIIAENMAAGKLGLRTGSGFYDYAGTDIDAYRQERLAGFSKLLRSLDLVRPPVLD